MKEEKCCYPDCSKIDGDVKEMFCLEHAKLARFIIEMVKANIELDDVLN